MPRKKYKTDALYEIPVYYTTQVLSQMAAKHLPLNNWLLFVTHQTVSHTSVDILMPNFCQGSGDLSQNAMEVRMHRDQLEGILKFKCWKTHLFFFSYYDPIKKLQKQEKCHRVTIIIPNFSTAIF